MIKKLINYEYGLDENDKNYFRGLPGGRKFFVDSAYEARVMAERRVERLFPKKKSESFNEYYRRLPKPVAVGLEPFLA